MTEIADNAATPKSAAVDNWACAFCPRCGIWRGHSSDCAVHNEPALPNGPCDCTLAGGDPLRDALLAIRALCPATDPGPARDPVWGDFFSSGNTDDCARDLADEELWQVALICDAALGNAGDAKQSSTRQTADDAMLSARPTPPDDLVEAIAREVDPEAWEEYLLEDGRVDQEVAAIFQEAYEESIVKARRILALIQKEGER